MSADTETLAAYAKAAAEYVNLMTDGSDPALEMLGPGLPKGARILDLGCGPGHLSAALRDRGFAVTALDASPEMASFAKRLHGIDVKVAGFDDLDERAAYDAVLANFSLLHATKAAMPRHLVAVHRALAPGGRLVIGLKTGRGEGRDALGRFYAYYRDAEITGLLRAAGFKIAARRTGSGRGLDGTVAAWILLAANA